MTSSRYIAPLQDNVNAKSIQVFHRPHNLDVIWSEIEIPSSAVKLEYGMLEDREGLKFMHQLQLLVSGWLE